MSRQILSLPQIASWDLVVTTSGVNILVVPHGISAERAVAADDGVVLDGAHPVHLLKSERIVTYLRRQPSLILVQAGTGPSLESVVPVVSYTGTVHARRQHVQSTAA